MKDNKYIKYVILILALAFIAIGVYGEEVMTVLHKAAGICMECIGIG